jgi:hypothetical protein
MKFRLWYYATVCTSFPGELDDSVVYKRWYRLRFYKGSQLEGHNLNLYLHGNFSLILTCVMKYYDVTCNVFNDAVSSSNS